MSADSRRRANPERARQRRRVAPVLVLAGAAVLYRCTAGVVEAGEPAWWLQFAAGLAAVFEGGFFFGAAAWEERAAEDGGGRRLP